MEPRLKTSTKWTDIPKEMLQQIEDVFLEQFSGFLAGRKIRIQARLYPKEVLFCAGIYQPGQLSQNNFEISSSYDLAAKDFMGSLHLAIDASASLMLEYLEKDGEVDFPYEWKSIEFDSKEIFFRYSTTNTELEAQADALLGKDPKSFYQEEEDPLDMTEEDDEESGGRKLH